jgi:predicted alpha/beta-fold hydrolase
VRAGSLLGGAGMHAACFNPRGRGGNELRTPMLYSAGYTEDLRRVVGAINRSFSPVANRNRQRRWAGQGG